MLHSLPLFTTIGLNLTPFLHRVKWKSPFFAESFLGLARLRQVGLPRTPSHSILRLPRRFPTGRVGAIPEET